LTWDGSTNASNVRIYENGTDVSEAIQNGIGARSGDSDALAIGASIELSDRNYDGLIDDVRIYNRALSAAEISKLYQMGR
jgi:hypothetical protein